MPESKEQEAYVRKLFPPNTYSIIVILLSIPSTWPILSKLTNQCIRLHGLAFVLSRVSDSHEAGQEIVCPMWTDLVKVTYYKKNKIQSKHSMYNSARQI